MFDHFDILAPFYDWLLGNRYPKRLSSLLRLPCQGWMLDAGGGTGRVSAHFQPLVGHLVISDTSRPMLRQSIGKSLLSVLARIEKLPFEKEVFDRILIVDALHHFIDQKTAIGESLRVLKPGGRLVIEEPDINLFAVKMAAAGEKLFRMRSRFLAPARISEIISEHGQQARIEKTRKFRTWIVVDKKASR